MEVRLSLVDWIFVAFVVVYAAAMLCLAVWSSFGPDEGTHATIALFYRDVLSNLPRFGSFDKLMSFGQEYLAHYPKLQVTYPPLWHVTTAVVFYSLFGVGALAAKFSTLFFSVASMCLMYLLVRRLFSDRVALLATVLFYANPMSVFFSHRALIDFSAYLFIFAALLAFFKAIEKDDWKLYSLAGFFSFLAAMGQRPAVLLFPLLFLYLLIEKKRNRLVHFSLPFLVPFLVYALFIAGVGGLAINYYTVQQAGITTGEPPVTDPAGWIWYLVNFVETTGPVSVLLIAAFVVFVYEKRPNWRFFLLWLAVMWVGLTVPQNKEARFYQLLFWPAYLAFSYYASLLVSRYGWKIIVPLVLVLVVYAYSSFVFVSAEATVHPTEEVVDYAVSHGNGNIGMLSETGYAYSSVFIFREAQLDPERTRFFFRPCAFENMTSGEIRDFAEENSIEWFLVVRRGDPVVIYEGNLKNLPDNIVLEKTFGEVELYRVKGFTPSSKVPCNRVCLTGEELCPSHSSPFDVLNS